MFNKNDNYADKITINFCHNHTPNIYNGYTTKFFYFTVCQMFTEFFPKNGVANDLYG